MVKELNIPASLKERNQWVLWRIVQRDRPTKVPFSVDGTPAKANDPATWTSFDVALARYQQGGYEGIGYEFTKDDPFVGIDLDGCRNPDSGVVSQWAKEIITEFGTYAEVSPSHTGVKLFVRGKLPFSSGRKVELKDLPPIGDKQPAIEVYEHGRYFAVTGLKLTGMPGDPLEREVHLAMLCERYWPQANRAETTDYYAPTAVMERARKYLAKCPPSISGQNGHNSAFHVACILLHGFQLERDQARSLMNEWNQTCQPPWSDRELEHKIDSASKQPGERGYLRNARPQQWGSISIPHYEAPKPQAKRPVVTLADAAQGYIDRLKSGKATVIRTGLPDLDHAIGGGVELGEMVIFAARPSHGKSAVALQCAHNWTADDMSVLFVTEEMSATALGKRTLLFASGVPQEEWRSSIADLEIDLNEFAGERANCFVVENCGTAEAVAVEIERAVRERGIKAAIVDYAQLLSSPGKSRYEQITNTSISLRKVASEQRIVLLVLCQLNREIESRERFQPKISDLKDTGQLEQDADVIVFLVWPHRIDQSQPANLYKFYVAKNRNREIVKPVVECRFEPSRQMMVGQRSRDLPNYEPAFEDDRWD